MRLSIRLAAGTLFVFAACSIAFITIGIQAIATKAITTSNLTSIIDTSAQTLKREINHADDLYRSALKLLRFRALASNKLESELISALQDTLRENPSLMSAHIVNDELKLQVVTIRLNHALQNLFNATPNDEFAVLIKRSRDDKQYLRLYDNEKAFHEVVTDIDMPRKSQLVDNTSTAIDNIHIAPARTSFSGHVVKTYATEQENLTIALDLPLETFSRTLTARSMGLREDSGVNVYLHDEQGNIMVSSQSPRSSYIGNTMQSGIALLFPQNRPKTTIRISNQYDWMPIDYSVGGLPKGYAVDILKIIGEKAHVDWHFVTDRWEQLKVRYQQGDIDALHSLRKTDELKGEYSQSMFSLPFATASLTDSPYDLVDGTGTLGIVSGWTIIPTLKTYSKSVLKEYETLQEVIEALEKGDIDAAIDSKIILESAKVQLGSPLYIHENKGFSSKVDTSFHLLLAPKYRHLMSQLNFAIESINSDTHQQLVDYWTSNRERISVPESAMNLKLDIIHRIDNFYIYRTPLERQNQFLTIVLPDTAVEDNANTVTIVLLLFTVVFIVLSMPFIWYLSKPIVKPILMIAKESQKIQNRQYREVQRVPTNIIEIDDLSRTIKATSDSLMEHEERHQNFLDSVIKMIAQAIDDKSTHTGGHCHRVPDIAMSFVEKLNNDTTKYADFHMNDQQSREYYVAAWLHDCGKLTVPEHIIDKGSKLEALYNRIHEIRTRFEVVLRDRKIEQLEAQYGPLKGDYLSNYESSFKSLQNDFERVGNANVGDEFFTDEKAEEILRIAEITWQRNFDDRIGLSPSERAHLNSCNILSTSLPHTEQLLSDKVEHIRPRDEYQLDDELGITMPVPEHEANLGEVYNLSIKRGTLTEEDRFAIQEHMVSTIKMLNSLPFPPELENVPRYASTHHEKMDGTGYPRGYDHSQLSLPERVLMIADIFEALTANDRPYKEAKTFDQAKGIIGYMAKDGHLDADLVDFFFDSGVAQEYLNSRYNSQLSESRDART